MDKKLTLSLGTYDAGQRKIALRLLATEADIIGRNKVPSISEMVCRIADAFEEEPETVVHYMTEIKRIAQSS